VNVIVNMDVDVGECEGEARETVTVSHCKMCAKRSRETQRARVDAGVPNGYIFKKFFKLHLSKEITYPRKPYYY